ncbi:MAG: hypothetical protein R8G66_15745 [Cytophagales bacterium]|nr:hypothetical protein [Cytophagales bacterium]
MADIDIQGLWAKGKQANRSNEPEIDIDEAIKGKSRNTLYWIKVILWIEFWINVISFPFIVLMFLEMESYGFLIFFSLLVAVYLVYYLFLIRSINQFNYLADVRSSLKKLYKYLNFYLLHYKVLIWTVFPGSFIYGLWLGIEQSGEDFPRDAQSWLKLIGISIICIGLMILIGNWMVNLIYGKKIKRLKGMVKELEEAG